MASKSAITGFRESAAAARPFETAYYSLNIHKSAFATPEFLRKRLSAI
jgi:spermidine synthase